MYHVMYIGPNIPRLGLTRNAVFYESLPGQVRAALLEIPELEELIVPIDTIDEAITKTRTKGEHLHHVYNVVIDKAAAKK